MFSFCHLFLLRLAKQPRVVYFQNSLLLHQFFVKYNPSFRCCTVSPYLLFERGNVVVSGLTLSSACSLLYDLTLFVDNCRIPWDSHAKFRLQWDKFFWGFTMSDNEVTVCPIWRVMQRLKWLEPVLDFNGVLVL